MTEESSYRTAFSPSPVYIVDVKISQEFVRHAVPNPLVSLLGVSLLVLEQLPVDILRAVPIAMPAPLD